jgi:3-hydroxyisobutyrate dehydrogenase-like beta-hydroxyacid dehydrogenase
MALRCVIIAQGAMGSAIGARLVAAGHQIFTVLEGRSPASQARAQQAGMQPIAMSQIANCDLFLSILPPSEALPLAQSVAPILQQALTKPIYVDANAVSPRTMQAIANCLGSAGGDLVDAGIIGGPPKQESSPAIYLSGARAEEVRARLDSNLDFRLLSGPIGAASALKMSYAGLTKGFQGLGAAMLSAAKQAGAGEALLAQLAQSQPDFLAYFRPQVPAMFPKAYRFVGEMEEIAAFLKDSGDTSAADIYLGLAKLFADFANEQPETEDRVTALRTLLT